MKRVYEYSQQHGMLDRWHFLIGDRKGLQPIWEYYWVGEVKKEMAGSAAPERSQRSAKRAASGGDPISPAPGPYTVQHTAPVHLIDQQGKVRVVYGSTFRPAELAQDIEVLLER